MKGKRLEKTIIKILEDDYSYNKVEGTETDIYEFELYFDNYDKEALQERTFENSDDANEFISYHIDDQMIDHKHNLILEMIEKVEEYTTEIPEYEDVDEVLMDLVRYKHHDENILDSIFVDVVVSLKSDDSEYIIDNQKVYTEALNIGNSRDDFAMIFDQNFERLLDSQDISMDDLYNYIIVDEGTDNEFTKQVYNEILNSYNYNVVSFLLRISLEEYFTISEKQSNESITIESGTRGGLLDFAMGGGSILNLELKNNFITERDNLIIFKDGEIGYSVKEIYGMRRFDE